MSKTDEVIEAITKVDELKLRLEQNMKERNEIRIEFAKIGTDVTVEQGYLETPEFDMELEVSYTLGVTTFLSSKFSKIS